MTKRSLLILAVVTLSVIGTITAAEAVTSKITTRNNLKLYGVAYNPAGRFTVEDDMVITEKLDAQGDIADSNGKLTLADDVAMTGDTITGGNAEIKGTIYNSNDVVTVNDDLYVGGLFSMNSIETPTSNMCETPGGLSYDSTYLYLCVAGVWKKVPLQTF